MTDTTEHQRRSFALNGPKAALDVESTATTAAAIFQPPSITSLVAAHSTQSEKTAVVLRSESTAHQSDDSTPSTPTNSRAPSPIKEVSDDLESKQEAKPLDRLLLWRLASGFFAYFLVGWSEGATGAAMPYMTAEYNLTSTLSSSIFAAYTLGFFIGTFCVEWLLSVAGRSRVREKSDKGHQNPESEFVFYSASKARYIVVLIAALVQSLFFVLMGSRAGFPVMFTAYIMSALARSLVTAPLNAYFATGPKQALGYGLGISTLGSVISPLVCQSVIAAGVPWYRFYYGSLVLCGLNILLLAKIYKPTALERQIEHHDALVKSRPSSISSSSVESKDLKGDSTSSIGSKDKTLLKALKMPYQWAISCVVLLYAGSEMVSQGFLVSYFIKVKGANPRTIGYVASGFWGGESVGRFIWGSVSPLLTFTQRKHIIHAGVCLAVVLQVLIWVLKSAVLNAVAASFIGLLYGPIFPACLEMANAILPAEVHMVAMALISSFASLGGAIFPMMMGAILDAKGMKSLTLLTVPLTATMALSWTFLPNRVPSPRLP